MDRRELRQYEAWKEEAQRLRAENQHLRLELMACRPALYRADQRVAGLEERVGKLEAENRRLRRRVKELTAAASSPPGARAGPGPRYAPPFAKPSLRGRRKKPGRKAGHPAALRPVPDHVDVDQDVPLPTDGGSRPACPHCNCSLSDVKHHERLVEDIVPSKVIVTCYRTASGYCAMCRRRVESRAPEQPPAANVPARAAGAQRPGHRGGAAGGAPPAVRPGGAGAGGPAGADRQRRRRREATAAAGRVARPVLRAGEAGAAGVARASTGTRPAGGPTAATATCGRSPTPATRSTTWTSGARRAVIEGLLGRSFPGTLTSDFYGAYNRLDCPKQRCLAHLLRELHDTAEKHPAFAQGTFCRKAVRLVKDMLALKRRWDELGEGCYTRRACRLEDRLDQLARAEYDEPHAERLARRLIKHRPELTRFLWDKELGGTNNAAERALRPAVVMRKITGGSRSATGAQAWAKLASLMRTASQQGRNVLETVKQLLVEHWAGKPAMALTSGP